MIYINENSGTISIPRHTMECVGEYTVVLNSNMSNRIVLVQGAENISTNSLYYKFALDNLSEIAVGEYTYKVYCHNTMVETGLLTFGNYSREVIVNNTFNVEKKQYNPSNKDGKSMSKIKLNTIYYGFGQSAKDMLENPLTLKPSNDFQYFYNGGIARKDYTHFYVVYATKGFNGIKPAQFICGGCPLVMFDSNEVIDGLNCVVWESYGTYEKGAMLGPSSYNY